MIPDKLLLDVGGTFIKCSDGREIPVDSAGSREQIASALREAVGANAPGMGDLQLRAAVPGPFDYASGQFLMKHKFAAVYGEYFADIVGLPRENCRFSHDVNCMLLGEIRTDASDSRPVRNTALIALGTGLGFAMCIGGEILKNELGSPRVSIFNRPYGDGTLEDYASKRGVLRLYAESCGKAPEDGLTVKRIADRAHGGEPEAAEAFRRMGSIIGEAIAPILAEYRVERLLLGGQISRSADLFAPALEEKLTNVQITPISDFDNTTFNGLKAL